MNVANFKDDESARAALGEFIRQAQSQQQFAQLGQQVMPRYSEFQKWEAEQQRIAQEKQSQQAKSWWQPPEFDPKWMEGVERDPTTGQLVARQGFAPDLPQKVANWQAFQRQMLEGLAKDPIEFLKGGLEPMIQQVATQLIQQHLGGFQAQQQIQRSVAEAEPWMYEKDSAGNIVIAPDGKRQFSLAGRIMHAHTIELENQFKSLGEKLGPQQLQYIFNTAKAMTEGTLYKMQAQAQAAPAAAAAPAAPAAPGANRLQNLSAAGPNGTAVPRAARKSFSEAAMAALDANGIKELR